MTRQILVPLDGSPFSEQALPVAIGVARRTGAALELVRVHEPLESLAAGNLTFVPGASVPGPPVPDPWVEEERRRADESYLRSTAARVGAQSGRDVAVAVLDGSPAEALARHVAARGPDLVVMTTHGRTGVSRVWLGSVAEGLVRRVPGAVLLVKPGEREPAAPPFRRVLVPLDGSPLSESVLEPSIGVVGAEDVEFTLVRATEPLTAQSVASLGAIADARQAEWERQDAEVDAYLDAVAERLRARGLAARWRSLVHVHAARAILETAAEIGADLIAMATHGRGGLRRFLLGSVADKVLRGAEVCVLLYRPADGEAIGER